MSRLRLARVVRCLFEEPLREVGEALGLVEVAADQLGGAQVQRDRRGRRALLRAARSAELGEEVREDLDGLWRATLRESLESGVTPTSTSAGTLES